MSEQSKKPSLLRRLLTVDVRNGRIVVHLGNWLGRNMDPISDNIQGQEREDRLQDALDQAEAVLKKKFLLEMDDLADDPGEVLAAGILTGERDMAYVAADYIQDTVKESPGYVSRMELEDMMKSMEWIKVNTDDIMCPVCHINKLHFASHHYNDCKLATVIGARKLKKGIVEANSITRTEARELMNG